MEVINVIQNVMIIGDTPARGLLAKRALDQRLERVTAVRRAATGVLFRVTRARRNVGPILVETSAPGCCFAKS